MPPNSRQPRHATTWSVMTLQLILTAALVLLGEVKTDDFIPATCQEPTDVMEMYRHLRRYVISHSSDIFDETTPHVQRNVSVTALHEARCVGHRNLMCNCPHRHEINFDPNRIPRVLVQASCCHHRHRNSRQGPGWHLECQDVTHHLPVLRRTGCIGDFYHYERVWEEVPVGCSCFTRPRLLWS